MDTYIHTYGDSGERIRERSGFLWYEKYLWCEDAEQLIYFRPRETHQDEIVLKRWRNNERHLQANKKICPSTKLNSTTIKTQKTFPPNHLSIHPPNQPSCFFWTSSLMISKGYPVITSIKKRNLSQIKSEYFYQKKRVRSEKREAQEIWNEKGGERKEREMKRILAVLTFEAIKIMWTASKVKARQGSVQWRAQLITTLTDIWSWLFEPRLWVCLESLDLKLKRWIVENESHSKRV